MSHNVELKASNRRRERKPKQGRKGKKREEVGKNCWKGGAKKYRTKRQEKRGKRLQ